MCRTLDPENPVARSEPSVFPFELEQDSVSTTKQSIFRDTSPQRHLHPNADRQRMPRAINELELSASAPNTLRIARAESPAGDRYAHSISPPAIQRQLATYLRPG
jgi:hypothetical protein